MHPRIASVFLLTALAAAAPAQDALRDGEWERDVDEFFPGAEPVDAEGEPTHWAVRVVDAMTRRPIPGAVVQIPWHPGGGTLDGERRFESVGVADDEGWARLFIDREFGKQDYVIVEAPGYAPTERADIGDDEVALVRGVDVPVVLRDSYGTPIPNARLAYELGCGHLPDLRAAITDEAGRAVFRSVDPRAEADVWIAAPGAHRTGVARLTSVWRPGAPDVSIQAVPGFDATGTIVRRNGEPVAGVRVGPKSSWRGWVVTGDDGAFRLRGIDDDDVILVEPPGEGAAAESFAVPPIGLARRFELGSTTRERFVDVAVRVRDEGDTPIGPVQVTAFRSDDGWTEREWVHVAGIAMLRLPEGKFTVATWNAEHLPRSAAVEAKVGEEPVVDLVLRRAPSLRLDTTRIRDLRLSLVSSTAVRYLRPDDFEEDVLGGVSGIGAIESGPRALRVYAYEDTDALVRIIPLPPPESWSERPLTVEWFEPTQIRARLVGPDGAAVRGWLAVGRHRVDTLPPEDVEPSTTPTAESRLTGAVEVIVFPEDRSAFAERVVAISLTGPGSPPVELGEIALLRSQGPALRVVPPVGVSADDVSWERHDGHHFVGGEFVEDGTYDDVGAELAPGTTIELDFSTSTREGEPTVPWLASLDGAPPWTLTWPTASLVVTVEGAYGLQLLESVVLIDGRPTVKHVVDEDGIGRFELRWMPAGPHDLIVADRDHFTRVRRVVLAEGERREITVRLRRRP